MTVQKEITPETLRCLPTSTTSPLEPERQRRGMKVLPNLLHSSKMRETYPRCCSIWNPQNDNKTSEIHQIGILVIWPAQDKLTEKWAFQASIYIV